jgi:hypothetical protein
MCQNRSHDVDVMMTYTWNLPNVGMIVGIKEQEPMVDRLPPSKNLSNMKGIFPEILMGINIIPSYSNFLNGKVPIMFLIKHIQL